MTSESVHIVGLGATTAVGRDAWSSAAAVRAGISGFTDHPYMIDTAGEPMRVALAPWLDIGLEGVERFQALLFPAIDEALLSIMQVGRELSIGLSLGLPAPRPGLPDNLENQLKRAIGERYRGRFIGLAAFPNGHAAGLLALDAAVKKLRQGTMDACVVAGVDSYMAPETLEWLEENDQLHSAGPLNNAWGFIPGEAGGAVLLARADIARSLRLESFGEVRRVGFATEANRIKTKTVCIGEGLTQAFRAALSGLGDAFKVTDVYCDMNGEPYRADEYGFACLRTKEWFASASDFVAAADCWGDVSAATGPLCAMLGLIAHFKSYANGGHLFCWASSEGGERVGVLLETASMRQ